MWVPRYAGIGSARKPQRFLRDGDLVTTRVSRMGELRNQIVLTRLT